MGFGYAGLGDGASVGGFLLEKDGWGKIEGRAGTSAMAKAIFFSNPQIRTGKSIS